MLYLIQQWQRSRVVEIQVLLSTRELPQIETSNLDSLVFTMTEEVPTEGSIPRTAQTEGTQQPSRSSGNGGGAAGVFPVTGASDEPPAQHIIHDVPPVWDG